MFCLADITRTNAAERPDKAALICDDRTLTYAELDAECCQVANALISAGVGSQDRVGFIGKNIPEYFTLTLGAGKVNAVDSGGQLAPGAARDGLPPRQCRGSGRRHRG